MTQDEAMKWVLDEMGKLTKENYITTYITCAELRPDDPHSSVVEYVMLPVDVYQRNDMGYEIMPVEVLAAHCKWDMRKTLVRVDTENTHISDNLYNIVEENAELHKHLKQLEDSNLRLDDWNKTCDFTIDACIETNTLQEELNKLQKEIEELKKTSQKPYRPMAMDVVDHNKVVGKLNF